MTERLRLHIISFGFRHGVPAAASLILDVRAIRNPHHDPALRSLTGLDEKVKADVLSHPMANPLIDHALALIHNRLETEGKRSLTIGIGCTGGNHRSVVIAEAVAQYDYWGKFRITHRDLDRSRLKGVAA